MIKPKLTPKQERFVEEYMVDLNATQAAIRAGYSKKTAKDIACQNLAKLNIQEAITEKRGKLSENTGITAERVLQEISKIALSDIRSLLDGDGNIRPVADWDDDAAAAVSGLDIQSSGAGAVTKKIKQWDKLAALEKLGRHLNLFDDEKSGGDIHIHFDSKEASF